MPMCTLSRAYWLLLTHMKCHLFPTVLGNETAHGCGREAPWHRSWKKRITAPSHPWYLSHNQETLKLSQLTRTSHQSRQISTVASSAHIWQLKTPRLTGHRLPKFTKLVGGRDMKHHRRKNPWEEQEQWVEAGVGPWSRGPLGWILCL